MPAHVALCPVTVDVLNEFEGGEVLAEVNVLRLSPMCEIEGPALTNARSFGLDSVRVY